jgi:hypothetical protein
MVQQINLTLQETLALVIILATQMVMEIMMDQTDWGKIIILGLTNLDNPPIYRVRTSNFLALWLALRLVMLFQYHLDQANRTFSRPTKDL